MSELAILLISLLRAAFGTNLLFHYQELVTIQADQLEETGRSAGSVTACSLACQVDLQGCELILHDPATGKCVLGRYERSQNTGPYIDVWVVEGKYSKYSNNMLMTWQLGGWHFL